MTSQELGIYKSAALPHYKTLANLPSSTLAKRRGLIERAARKANLKEKYIDLPEHAPLREKAKGIPSTSRANRMDMLQSRIHHARETYQAASETNRNTNRARQSFQNEKARPPFQKSSEVHNMNLTDLGFHKCAATKGVPSFAPQPARKPAADLGSFIANKATSNPLTGANELLRQPGAALKAQLKAPVPSGSIYKSPAGMKSPSLMGRLLPDGVRNVLKRFVR